MGIGWRGESKGFRRVHLPLIGENGEVKEYTNKNEPSWMVQVFVHPGIADKKLAVRRAVCEELGLSIYEM